MSSILDALKKSERQRSLGRDLIFRNASPNATPRLTAFAVAVLATLLLLAVAIGALLFSLREPELPPPATTSAEAPAPATVSGAGADPVNTMAATVPAPAARGRRCQPWTVRRTPASKPLRCRKDQPEQQRLQQWMRPVPQWIRGR